MRDLTLAQDGDLLIEKLDLKLTTEQEIVSQRLKQALLIFKGEWFLNVEIGIPYYESILGEKNSLQTIKAIFIETIEKVKGVKELMKFEIKQPVNRALGISFSVIDEFDNLIELEI